MQLRNRLENRKRAAFTLMEIIVVVAIIMVLVGAGALILPGFLADAHVKRARMDVKAIEKAITAYSVNNNGMLPQSLEQLTVRDQQTGRAAYMDITLLTDPWGVHYIYEPQTLHPQTLVPLVYSQGPKDRAERIANWSEGQQ